MKILIKALYLVLCFYTIACLPISTNSGISFFSDVKESIAFLNGVSSIKTGQSCQESFFALFSFGDSLTEKAKQDGGITKIAMINVEKNILRLW
jgi:hypothetical protein